MSINDKIAAFRSLLESLKTLRAILTSRNYEEISDVLFQLRYSDEWEQLNYSEFNGGHSSKDITMIYDFYNPTINKGVNIYINHSTKYATISRCNIHDLDISNLNKR